MTQTQTNILLAISEALAMVEDETLKGELRELITLLAKTL